MSYFHRLCIYSEIIPFFEEIGNLNGDGEKLDAVYHKIIVHLRGLVETIKDIL
jgi:hypothetical protein